MPSAAGELKIIFITLDKSGDLIMLRRHMVLKDTFKLFDMKKDLEKYWRKNLQYLMILLAIWFIAGFLLSIVFAEELNYIKIGGFKLGFWFAQQGSIYIFVILIFVYVRLMNRLDKKFDVDEK